MKKLISILGSTGSIGHTTLKILDKKRILLFRIFFQQTRILNLFVLKLKNINQKYFDKQWKSLR